MFRRRRIKRRKMSITKVWKSFSKNHALISSVIQIVSLPVILLTALLMFSEIKKLMTAPDLSLEFTYSRMKGFLDFHLVNNNRVLADDPQVRGTVYFVDTSNPKDLFEMTPLNDYPDLPRFVHPASRLGPLLLDSRFSYPFPAERTTKRLFIHCYVICKNCPDSKEYWITLAESMWVGQKTPVRVVSVDSLISDPDSYVDMLIPFNRRKPIQVSY